MNSKGDMFRGYYGRNRLKTLLISIIGSLILVVLIYRHRNIFLFSRFRSNRLNIPKQISNKITLQSNSGSVSKNLLPLPSAFHKTSDNILSLIEFINSPFLDLEFDSSNIIPILVLSKASNIEVRDAIRRTWGFNRAYRNNTIHIKVFFLVGTDDYMIKRIHAEQIIFGDVIHVSLPEIYSFSAYKELSAMIWVRSYLPKAPFYIKTEDDAIINTKFMIDNLLPTIEHVINENVVIGWFGSQHFIQRGTYQKFINAMIPPTYIDLYYAMNLFYIVTSKASDSMLDALSHVNIIEYPGDPFVTGILRDAAYVQIKNLLGNVQDYKYELSYGACKEAFEKNSKLLLCTSSLYMGFRRSIIPEYFEAWDLLLNQN